MPVYLALGIGAGAASALLFAAAGSGSLPAALLLYLAPLPVMIVALGWHHLLGLLALAVGAITTSLVMRSQAGVAFALGPALSAWALGWLALVRRPRADASGNSVAPGEWYPLGHLLLWIALGSAAVAVVSLLAASGWNYDSHRETLEQMAGALLRREGRSGRQTPIPGAFGISASDFVRALVGMAPALLGGMIVLILSLNLWLAAKVVAISGRLARPWPEVSGTRMPVAALAVAAVAFGLAQLGGFTGVIGTALAGAMLVAFALEGLAFVHAQSQGRTGRGLILSFVYVALLLLGYVFLPVFALVGMADSALPLRRARGGGGPPRPSPPKPGLPKE